MIAFLCRSGGEVAGIQRSERIQVGPKVEMRQEENQGGAKGNAEYGNHKGC